jgi:hypothetical protein
MNTERPWDFSSFKSSIKDSSAHLNIYIIVDYRILEKKCLEKNRLQCMRRLSANVNDSRIWTPAEAERLRPRLKNGTGERGTEDGRQPLETCRHHPRRFLKADLILSDVKGP